MIEIEICPACSGTSFTPHLRTKDYTVTGTEFHLKKCVNCSLIITSPQPDEIEIGRFYQSQDYISHTNRSNSLINLAYKMARIFTLSAKYNLINSGTPERTILDYGCGTGAFLKYCQSKGWLVRGIEPSETARQTATNDLGEGAVQSQLPDEPSRFHIITLWHVLEHVHKPNVLLPLLKKKLAQKGRLIIAVPNPNAWDSTFYVEVWAAFDAPRHLWHFNKSALIKLVENHGFTLISTHPMKLDAYYVSILSEKYLRNQKTTIPGIINAVKNGFKSNTHAEKTGEYSSLIYIFEHASI